MDLTFLLEGLITSISFMTAFFVLDFSFYKLFKLKPLMFDCIATDIDRFCWLLTEVGAKYTITKLKSGDQIVDTDPGWFHFSSKGKWLW